MSTRSFLEVAENALDSAMIAIDRGNYERGVLNVQISIAAALIAIAKNIRPASDIDPEAVK